MKSQISPAATAGIIAVVVIIIAIALWRSFAGPAPASNGTGLPSSAPTAPGQLPRGVAPPRGAPGTQ